MRILVIGGRPVGTNPNDLAVGLKADGERRILAQI